MAGGGGGRGNKGSGAWAGAEVRRGAAARPGNAGLAGTGRAGDQPPVRPRTKRGGRARQQRPTVAGRPHRRARYRGVVRAHKIVVGVKNAGPSRIAEALRAGCRGGSGVRPGQVVSGEPPRPAAGHAVGA